MIAADACFKTDHFEFVNYTKMTPEQSRIIWEGRNHPEVRKWMANFEPFPLEEHLQYVQSLRDRNDRLYWAVLHEGEVIGSYCLNPYHPAMAEGEIGNYLLPACSGKGLGTLATKEFVDYMFSFGNLKRIIARTLITNRRYQHVNRSLGFRITASDDRYVYMEITKKDMKRKHVFIVAELSANHNHKIENAIRSIQKAKEIGADAIKLQTYTADTLTIDCRREGFVQTSGLWKGQSLYQLYQKAYTPWEWHEELFRVAREEGIICFSTPFDPTAVDLLESLNNPIYKIASFEITDIPLIRYIASKQKPIVLSTGIAMKEDIDLALSAIREEGNQDITLLKCTSAYPAPVDEANLLTIPDMKQRFDVKVGLSDHTTGSDVAIAAVALGAEMIEKHFILDRSIGGPDSAFSMEADDFEKMIRSIRNVEQALGTVSYPVDPDAIQGRMLCRSLYVVKAMKQGDVITQDNVRSIRPGYGLPPKYLPEILGKKVNRDLLPGDPFRLDFLS